ncbi:MAG: sigma-70 family RNA polymerase sigma factor [Oscillospiraceae bacterium]|nr:sigma-70 family RNA polymerase sigma factor [Oscillospiraceae bacterium]
MISGELKRYLRDNTPIRISRSLRDLAYRAMQAKEELTAELMREPDITEIASRLDMPKAEVVTALESISDPLSLYEPVYSDSGDTLFILDQIGDGNDSDGWINELSFKEAMVSLTEREKRILYLRFLKGRTQMEVAKEIGISQAQVSRLEKNTLDKLKGE